MGPAEQPNGADKDETSEAMLYDGWSFVPLSQTDFGLKPVEPEMRNGEAAESP